MCRGRIAGNELFRPPRGTRDSVAIIVVIVIVLYPGRKLIRGLVFIFSSWAVFLPETQLLLHNDIFALKLISGLAVMRMRGNIFFTKI